jgi:hypothetical protein
MLIMTHFIFMDYVIGENAHVTMNSQGAWVSRLFMETYSLDPISGRKHPSWESRCPLFININSGYEIFI